jgi:hypothetical protein
MGVFQQRLPSRVIERLIGAAATQQGAARADSFGRPFEAEAITDNGGMKSAIRLKRRLALVRLG